MNVHRGRPTNRQPLKTTSSVCNHHIHVFHSRLIGSVHGNWKDTLCHTGYRMQTSSSGYRTINKPQSTFSPEEPNRLYAIIQTSIHSHFRPRRLHNWDAQRTTHDRSAQDLRQSRPQGPHHGSEATHWSVRNSQQAAHQNMNDARREIGRAHV